MFTILRNSLYRGSLYRDMSVLGNLMTVSTSTKMTQSTTYIGTIFMILHNGTNITYYIFHLPLEVIYNNQFLNPCYTNTTWHAKNNTGSIDTTFGKFQRGDIDFKFLPFMHLTVP